MQWLELFFEWRRARRSWRRRRQVFSLLIFLLVCIICNAGMMACGMVVYTMQEIGLLPTLTPTPEATPYPSGGSRTLPGMLLSPLLL